MKIKMTWGPYCAITLIIGSVTLLALLAALTNSAFVSATPFTPLDWQQRDPQTSQLKLIGWSRDTNQNYIDNEIDIMLEGISKALPSSASSDGGISTGVSQVKALTKVPVVSSTVWTDVNITLGRLTVRGEAMPRDHVTIIGIYGDNSEATLFRLRADRTGAFEQVRSITVDKAPCAIVAEVNGLPSAEVYIEGTPAIACRDAQSYDVYGEIPLGATGVNTVDDIYDVYNVGANLVHTYSGSAARAMSSNEYDDPTTMSGALKQLGMKFIYPMHGTFNKMLAEDVHPGDTEILISRSHRSQSVVDFETLTDLRIGDEKITCKEEIICDVCICTFCEDCEGCVDVYDLRLMSVATTDDLLYEGQSLVIVAFVGTDLHIRIFDGNREIVVDKAESEFIDGEALARLWQRLDPFPDESNISPEEKQEIIKYATSSAGHPRVDCKGCEGRLACEGCENCEGCTTCELSNPCDDVGSWGSWTPTKKCEHPYFIKLSECSSTGHDSIAEFHPKHTYVIDPAWVKSFVTNVQSSENLWGYWTMDDAQGFQKDAHRELYNLIKEYDTSDDHVCMMGLGAPHSLDNFDKDAADAVGIYGYLARGDATELHEQSVNEVRFIAGHVRSVKPEIGILGWYTAFRSDYEALAAFDSFPSSDLLQEELSYYMNIGADGLIGYLYDNHIPTHLDVGFKESDLGNQIVDSYYEIQQQTFDINPIDLPAPKLYQSLVGDQARPGKGRELIVFDTATVKNIQDIAKALKGVVEVTSQEFVVDGTSYPLKAVFPKNTCTSSQQLKFNFKVLSTDDWSQHQYLEIPCYNPGDETVPIRFF